MVTLLPIHYIFIIMTIIILIALLFKKEIVIPCIIGILLIGITYTGRLIKGIQVLTASLIASNVELFGIMLVIALVTAMSKSMQAIGVDELLMRPVRKLIRHPKGAFWGIGICMLIVSWLIWPSPAVALIGALLLPVACAIGLPAIWAAVAMNLFGHGMALSSDFFIQGAPAISAKGAQIEVSDLISSSIPLWLVMSITVLIVSYIMMCRDLKKAQKQKANISIIQKSNGKKISLESTKITDLFDSSDSTLKSTLKTGRLHKLKPIIMAVLVILTFTVIIILMLKLHIMGGDATALIAGAALILTCIITFTNSGISLGLEQTVDYLKDGFIFAIKIFAPVIVIAAFFFLGSESFAKTVLGAGAPAILKDISLLISQRVPVTKPAVILIEAAVGAITGLDGSGFSGLPLTGTIAHTFGTTSGLSIPTLASLGQITTIWVGGGTIIPWAVIPVAAICGIKPSTLARKNLIPVMIGLIVTCITAVFLI